MRNLRCRLSNLPKIIQSVSGKGKIQIPTARVVSQCSPSLRCAHRAYWDQCLAQSQPTLPVSYYCKRAKSSLGIALIIHFGPNADCTHWQIAPCSSASKATQKLLGGTLDSPTPSTPHPSSHQLLRMPQPSSFPIAMVYVDLNVHFSPALAQYTPKESLFPPDLLQPCH